MKIQVRIYFIIISILFFGLLTKGSLAADKKPVLIIFDTDMGPDYDDVGALAVLHAMADSREARILACGSSNLYEKSVPAIEIINTYFGRPEIPVGAVKGKARSIGTWHKIRKWPEELSVRYPHATALTTEAPDAVTIYRKVLAGQPDKSVVVVTVGFMTNMRYLLESPPDSISKLPGKELVEKKVKRLVSMGGDFVEKKDVFNFKSDIESAQHVFQNWPTPILISGGEIGRPVRTGDRLIAANIADSPVRDAYEMSITEDRMDTVSTIRYRKGGRSSYDQTAVLVAVRDTSGYFGLERGTMRVNDNAAIEWTPNISGNHYRLLNKMPTSELAGVIEGLMMHHPVNQYNPWSDDLDIGAMVQPVPESNKFIDPGYYVWCGSVTKGKDDKFYMLYSRWPLKDGFYSWPITSEVAVAVSDHPAGPFRHLKVALPARGTQYWDGSATHNPAVVSHKGRYYLYYMGTSSTAEISFPARSSGNWWHYRNSQRIGVAVADDPAGEWKRMDHPVLDVSPDSTAYDALMVSNPAAAFDDRGRVILLYKQVCKNGQINGGKVRFGVAFADSPFGPFKKHNKPVFEAVDGEKEWMVAEDPFVWFHKGTYLAVVRDVVGKFTGDSGAFALMVSKNGTDWQPARHPKVIGSTFLWENGVKSVSKLERPCIYLENGVPKYLYGATRADKEEKLTFNVAVPLIP